MPKFVHLHTHSHYSLLQALPKIPDLVKRAKECGMNALALTDNGNLYGAIEFYKECKKAGIKPIIGVDAYLAVRTRHDKQAGIDNKRHRLILLALNNAGYHNLIKLVTLSYLEGFYYRPRIDRELLEKHGEGLVAISSALGGEIASAIKNSDSQKAAEICSWYEKCFGRDKFFIEITRHPEIENHEPLMEEVARFARERKTGIVAGQEVFYLDRGDKKARDTLLSIQNGGESREARFGANDEENFSFTTPEEAETMFEKMPEAIENAKKIAEQSNLELHLGKWVFPDYRTAHGRTHDDELGAKTLEGLKAKNLEANPEALKRIEYELQIIKDKGYAPYFLVVADLLSEAHKNNIITTTRGSAAGSLVSYLTGITNVDPLEYKLPFERFLNPERPSPPDIDMDIADNRRDEMIDYVKKKYGADKVAQIGTFGTMMARGAVRDVARAMGFDYQTGDKIAKLIPFGSQGFPMSIDKAMEIVPELKALYKQEKDAAAIIDMAKKIEGLARHISVHAAGVVISPTPLTDYTPLQYDPKGEGLPAGKAGKIITQYDMHAIEDAGLLKFDFLGIRNLAILAYSISLALKLEGKKIDIENIPLNDKKTFEMLAKGETVGLFQLNGSGMTRYLKDLKPTSIHDINAMVALYRPGPMESIPRYIQRKHNPRLVDYLDPRMSEILDQSYGVITYQDDVLQIAVRLAGYSWGEADKLRKAMGKKIPKEMEAQKEKLIAGFKRNGLSDKKAEQLWNLIEPFAAYGFNRAHAASYGRVAYQTAYMKANFPAIYMAAVLTAESGDVEKIGEIVSECKRMGILVLPPSVNESFSDFTVVKAEREPTANHQQPEKEKIRFGLTTIKNFGQGVSTSIIETRKAGGRFTSLENFLERVQDKNLNKKSLEALIKAGALDEFGERGIMLKNIEKLLEWNREASRAPTNQDSLFGALPATPSSLRLDPMPPAGTTEKLAWEKELLGLYISGHPLDKYKETLQKREINIRKIKTEMKEGMLAVIGGLVEEAKTVTTKNNEQMMFLKIADLSDSIEVVVFPRVFGEYKTLLGPDRLIAVKGRISERNGEISLIAEKIKELN